MTVELALMFAGISALCAWLGFLKGKSKDDKAQGQNQGQLEADVRYIKTGIDDIKKTVEGHEIKIWDIAKDVVSMKESVKSAHHRIDSLEKRGE